MTSAPSSAGPSETPRTGAVGAVARAGTSLPVGVALVLALAVSSASIRAQDIGDAARLTGVAAVGTRVSSSWDEEITMSAGGATGAQFDEALELGFREAIEGSGSGPALSDDAAGFVGCHVDTFYDRGLIVYAVRVSYHRRDAQGRFVIAWLRSWVGSYTTQQLHVMWSLADQCADAFLDAWGEGNG